MASKNTLTCLFQTIILFPLSLGSMTFQANVYDEYVILGNIGLFKCYFPNFLRDHVKVSSWIQDDGRVFEDKMLPKSGSRIFSLNGNLYIVGVNRQDTHHSFKCQVHNSITNELITSTSSGKLVVTDPFTFLISIEDPNGNVQPSISNTQRTIKSIVGSTVYLPCVAHGFPVPHYRWFKRHQETNLNTDIQDLLTGTGILIINNVSSSDSGRYICVANNSAGEDRIVFDLTVKQPLSVQLELFNTISGDIIEPGLTPALSITLGSQLRLHCKITGYPIHLVTWFRDGKPLNLNSTFNGSSYSNRIKLNSSNRMLTLYKVNRSDIGCYSCSVTGDSSESTISSTKCLTLSEDAPQLKETFSELITSPGERLSLKCVASGNPLPTVTWTLDDQPIPETHRIQYGDYVSMNGDVVSYVNITSLRSEDGGLYQCDAHNDAGSAHHSQMIYLKGKPFIRPMINMTALAGQQVKIRCPVSGHPITRIIWFKDDHELPINDRQRVHKNGSLIIKEARRDLDEGFYSCKASNDQGESDEKRFYIQVLRKPSISSFSFPSHLTEKMRVIITCNVLTGDPPISVDWLKDNLTISNDNLDDVQITELTDLGSSLVFRDVKQKHAGSYTCLATNQVGQDSYTAQMIVKVPPKWIIEPTDKSAIVGERVTFDCQADGFPMPIIRWKISTEGKSDFKSVSSNYHIQTLENGSLTIKETDKPDSAYYLCEAENGIGSVLSKVVSLTVHIQAHFKSTFQVMRVKIGEMVNISCEAFGEKPINIKWLKERTEIDFLSDRRYTVSEKETPTGLISNLITPVSTRSDSGSFLCITWNPYGQSEMTSRVLVEEPPDPPSDLIAHEFGSKSISLRYSLPYSGNSPVTKYIIQWKKDGVKLSHHLCTIFHLSSSFLFSPSTSSSHLHSSNLRYNSPRRFQNHLHIFFSSLTKSITFLTYPHLILDNFLHPSFFSLFLPFPSWLIIPCLHHYHHHRQLDYDHGLISTLIVNRNTSTWSKASTTEIDGTATQVFINDLKPLTNYDIRMFAVNNIGKSEPSKVITITTDEEAPLTSPVSVRAEAISSTSILVKWKPPKHIESFGSVTGYYIGYKELHTEKSFIFKTVENKLNSKLQITISNLRKSTSYIFTVQAFNTKGAGPQSPETVAKTLDKDAPLSPKLGIVSFTASTVTISWILPIDSEAPIDDFIFFFFSSSRSFSLSLIGFKVFLRQSSSDFKSHETINDGKLTSHTIRSLHCGTKYTIYMVSFNEIGESEPSEALSFQTEGGAPIAPDKSSLLHINSTFVFLQLSSWRTTSCPINNFIVQYKEQGNTEWILVSNTVSSVLDQFLVSNLQPATWYNLLIAAQSDAGSTEAEYFFATLTEQGETIAPMSVSSNPDEHRLRRYVQMVLPVTSVFISLLVVVIFILFFGFRKNRNMSAVTNLNDQVSPKAADNISMSSTKVVYETVQRDERTSVYCPSPYATTRVSLYFQDNPMKLQTNENSYDMPLLKTHPNNRSLYDFQGTTSGSCENNNLLDINHEPLYPR
uniref:Down syndrome cell adhesion molecule n=1 Tax=Tetranychus urticae TaxID=32264 RepID=T1K8A2_TETUR